MGQRTCTLCGAVFIGRIDAQVCSQKCRSRRNKTYKGFVERRQAERIAYRARNKARLVYCCLQCSTMFGTTNPSHTPPKYCSKSCEGQAKAVRYRKNPVRYPQCHIQYLSCKQCKTPTIVDPRLGRPLGGWRRLAGGPWHCPSCPPTALWHAGSCRRCNRSFVSPGQPSEHCSDRCSTSDARDRRRALKKAAFVENVYRRRIFERDGWRCQICRKLVRKTAVVPHPLAPVLDHIHPLAVGGTHEPSNVQCAHFMCNSIKSHGIGGNGDQLRLIG